MNKTEVVGSLVAKTGLDEATCARVIDALEDVSGDILAARLRGIKLSESDAVEQICEKTGLGTNTCMPVLVAFEETFGEALADTFRFFK